MKNFAKICLAVITANMTVLAFLVAISRFMKKSDVKDEKPPNHEPEDDVAEEVKRDERAKSRKIEDSLNNLMNYSVKTGLTTKGAKDV